MNGRARSSPTLQELENNKSGSSRSGLEHLLATATAPGSFACTGTVRLVGHDEDQQNEDQGEQLRLTEGSLPCIVLNPAPSAPPAKRLRSSTSCQPALQWPIGPADKARVLELAQPAGVGAAGAEPGGEVVDPQARRSWQLLPDQFSITNPEFTTDTLGQILTHVALQLGVGEDRPIRAELYKFLLYEGGCFFRPHRDTERLPGMFGTLIVQLPSVYTGAELRVHSPSSERHVKRIDGSQSCAGTMHFAAFYNDCLHQVTELLTGTRCVLVFSLVAQPQPGRTLHQPADAKIAKQIARLIATLEVESQEKYPIPSCGWRLPTTNYKKPAKFAIVLHHQYTPLGLESMLDLKGCDRAVAELVAAARSQSCETLKDRACHQLLNNEQLYAACPPDHPVHMVLTQYLDSEAAATDQKPEFDAFISLAILWDAGEQSPPQKFFTTGPLIPLLSSDPPSALNVGPPSAAAHLPHWHEKGSSGHNVDPEGDQFEYDESGMNVLAINGRPYDPIDYEAPATSNSLAIEPGELLLSNPEARQHRDADDWAPECDDNFPTNLEFLGNGMPYMGRWFSRAVLLMWPRSHRTQVEQQIIPPCNSYTSTMYMS
jgi:hypothetical protein